MRFTVTVRYGTRPVRYHTLTVEAPDLRAALAAVSERLPDPVAAHGDLVEIRATPDPAARG